MILIIFIINVFMKNMKFIIKYLFIYFFFILVFHYKYLKKEQYNSNIKKLNFLLLLNLFLTLKI